MKERRPSSADSRPGHTLDALDEEYSPSRDFRAPLEEESINHLVQDSRLRAPVATRQGSRSGSKSIERPHDGDRSRSSAPGGAEPRQERLETLSSGGELTIASRFDGEAVESPSPTPAAASRRTSSPARAILHHEAAGHRPRSLDHAPDRREHGGEVSWDEPCAARRDVHNPAAIKRVTDG